MDLLYDVAAKQEETETETEMGTGTGTRTRAGTKRGVGKDLYFHLSKFVSYLVVLSVVV